MDLPILLYHHLVEGENVDAGHYEVSLRQFEEQLDTLRRLKFETIHFATLTEMMEGREKPRPRMAIITFDDAFRSFHQLALPALKRRGMRATVFVPAGEIGGSNRWDGAKGFPRREIMSEDELREIAADGMEIGSHGWAHRSLPECSDAEAREELVRSRERLHALGHAADVFAYPHGHYSQTSKELVAAAGYRAAVSIFSDAPSVTADRYAMRRIYVHPGDTPWRFRGKLSRPYLRLMARRGKPAEASPVVK
jgi:peptidoglycan/xylan/chitin deacetylase (PgdA/CDA1 family)